MMATAGVEIHNARFVCASLLAGQTVDWIAQQFAAVPDGDGTPGRITPAEARRFIPVAVKHHCPGAPLRTSSGVPIAYTPARCRRWYAHEQIQWRRRSQGGSLSCCG